MKRLMLDRAIFDMQQSGGISTLWRGLLPSLKEELAAWEFVGTLPADVFMSTYYQAAPDSVPSVVMVYDLIAARTSGLRFRPDVQWQHDAIDQASRLIAISDWTREDIERSYRQSAIVAYPATSLQRASHEDVQALKAKYNLPDTYVLIVGRRDLYKNVSTYWQALKMLSPRPFTLCIGGEDEPLEYGLRVTIDESELAAAYTGAMCLVYPSLYEGFGLPVLEASACGCAVICGNGGALKEINHGALVVNVTRPREIAQALVTLMSPGDRIGFILKGYETARRFTWQAMAKAVAGEIRKAAEGST